MKNTTSFLRWAGGKTKLVKKLLLFIPEDIQKYRYIEPFIGGGSLFFTVSPKNAIISDLNTHLIKCYIFVRDNPEKVYKYLMFLANEHSSSSYYKIRDIYNSSEYSIEQAARFIYLNKTSFNGIFRVNNNGKFNVPYGKKDSPVFPSLDQLVKASKILKYTQIYNYSYDDLPINYRNGDFVYLDPPYPPLNGTSFFTHYTSERFNDDDQLHLANFAKKLDKNNCKIMISNADTPRIRKYYNGWNINSLSVTRWITCKSIKHKVNELIITNY